jgi:hypothetical protein
MHNRREFLKTLIGGVAASAAVRTWPFRVYSFPSEPIRSWPDGPWGLSVPIGRVDFLDMRYWGKNEFIILQEMPDELARFVRTYNRDLIVSAPSAKIDGLEKPCDW